MIGPVIRYCRRHANVIDSVSGPFVIGSRSRRTLTTCVRNSIRLRRCRTCGGVETCPGDRRPERAHSHPACTVGAGYLRPFVESNRTWNYTTVSLDRDRPPRSLDGNTYCDFAVNTRTTLKTSGPEISVRIVIASVKCYFHHLVSRCWIRSCHSSPLRGLVREPDGASAPSRRERHGRVHLAP